VRKIKGNKRAISPVFSTVILVLIVVVGMSAVFTFFVDYVSDYQAGRGSSVMELLEIEDVRFVGNDSMEVWLFNYGELDLKLDSVYVNRLNATLNYYSGDWSLNPNQHKKFTVTLYDVWLPDGSYILRFITERGTAVEREYTAPTI
jgi:flagellin-like protein